MYGRITQTQQVKGSLLSPQVYSEVLEGLIARAGLVVREVHGTPILGQAAFMAIELDDRIEDQALHALC